MLCKNPWMRSKDGVTSKEYLLSHEARLSATPFGCGQCLPCLINKARVWTNRILIENQMHEKSAFVTLTYDNPNLVGKVLLDKRDLQLFMKKLRKGLGYLNWFVKIRYFAIGEYGDKSNRKHWHVMLFGINDKKYIEKVWDKGFIYIGDVSKDSARYVTNYVIKNMRDDRGNKLEHMLVSRKPGIGGDAAIEIGKSIAKDKYVKDQKVYEFMIGKKNLPLGRYLNEKVKEGRGYSGEDKTQLLEYQDKLKEQFSDGEGLYIDRMVEANKGKHDSIERRNQLWSQKRSI